MDKHWIEINMGTDSIDNGLGMTVFDLWQQHSAWSVALGLVRGTVDGRWWFYRQSTKPKVSKVLLRDVDWTMRIRYCKSPPSLSILDVPDDSMLSLFSVVWFERTQFSNDLCFFLLTTPFFDPTAFPENIPNKAYACQEAKAEPPFATLGPSANRQYY